MANETLNREQFNEKVKNDIMRCNKPIMEIIKQVRHDEHYKTMDEFNIIHDKDKIDLLTKQVSDFRTCVESRSKPRIFIDNIKFIMRSL